MKSAKNIFPLLAITAAGFASMGNANAAEQLRALRVCADPGNMPLSNDKREGYQNKIAEVLGEALGTGVSYDYWPSTERGLIRATLNANRCDVMFDLPAGMEIVLTTEPLYRSTFVLAYPSERAYDFKSLADPRLKELKVGVYQMSSIRESLARNDVKQNTVTQFISYDGAKIPENQPTYQVQRMIDGELDVVAILGSFAGWYKAIKGEAITIQPVNLMDDVIPLQYDMALGVRRGDFGLKAKLEEVLRDKKDVVRKILDDYGVPLVQCDRCIISGDLVAHAPYTSDEEQRVARVPVKADPGASLEQLKQWLAGGADAEKELSNAATAGDPVRVAYLLDMGVDINVRDSEGYTPLLTAVRTRYNALAELLVARGADVNLADNDDWTPLMYAAWRDSPEIVRILIGKGAPVNAKHAKGLTPLAVAAQHGKTQALKALLEAKPDIDLTVGGAGYTPLMLALVGGFDNTAQALIEGGADVNAKNAAGITPLMIAAAGDRAASARLLLERGAKIDAKGENGITALGIASERENKAVIEVLQQAASGRGKTAAEKAA